VGAGDEHFFLVDEISHGKRGGNTLKFEPN